MQKYWKDLLKWIEEGKLTPEMVSHESCQFPILQLFHYLASCFSLDGILQVDFYAVDLQGLGHSLFKTECIYLCRSSHTSCP